GIYVSGYRKYGNSETRRKPAPCLEGIRHLRSRPCQGPPEKTNALVLSYLWGTNLVPPGDPRSHQEIRGNPSLQKSAVSWLRGGIIPKGLPVEVVALSPRRLLLHLLDSSRTLLLRRSSEIDFFPSRNQFVRDCSMASFPWCVCKIVHPLKTMKVLSNAALLLLVSCSWKL
ncbi:mCG1034286, isoform CRA_a, partial [Mus musculus]